MAKAKNYIWEDNAFYKLRHELSMKSKDDQWKKGVETAFEQLSQKQILPSRFQLGDAVKVEFKDNGSFSGEVIKVHFTYGKVLYDIEVSFSYVGLEEKGSTRLYNIDAAFVLKQ